MILICDNEEPLRALVRATLEDLGHELVEAEDGDEALVLMRQRRPDLLVLDVMMPGRSGLDVVTEIRADPELAKTKIVVVSARAQAADALAAEQAGADRFVRKPFSPLELERVVTDLLAS